MLLTDLPVECIEAVTAALARSGDVRSLARLAQTCRRVRDVVNASDSLWALADAATAHVDADSEDDEVRDDEVARTPPARPRDRVVCRVSIAREVDAIMTTLSTVRDPGTVRLLTRAVVMGGRETLAPLRRVLRSSPPSEDLTRKFYARRTIERITRRRILREWARLPYFSTLPDVATETASLLLDYFVHGSAARPSATRAALDRLADSARLADAAVTFRQRLNAVLHALFQGADAFVGDRETYDSPDNSYLSLVLRRRRGLPITLSILLCAVARRVGLTLHCLNTPAHVVVQGTDTDTGKMLVIDAFDRGRVMSAETAAAMFHMPPERPPEWHFAPAEPAAIWRRQLWNLVGRADCQAEVIELAVDLLGHNMARQRRNMLLFWADRALLSSAFHWDLVIGRLEDEMHSPVPAPDPVDDHATGNGEMRAYLARAEQGWNALFADLRPARAPIGPPPDGTFRIGQLLWDAGQAAAVVACDWRQQVVQVLGANSETSVPVLPSMLTPVGRDELPWAVVPLLHSRFIGFHFCRYIPGVGFEPSLARRP